MAYTEIQNRNNRKYYYRSISIRKDKKISKKKIYMGINLDTLQLKNKEKEVDIILSKLKSMKRKNKTIDKIKTKIVKILKKYGITKAGIFGSFARGEQKKGSDIDILIELSKPLGFEFVGLQDKLSKALKKKVDLVTYNGLNHLIKERVLNEEIRII